MLADVGTFQTPERVGRYELLAQLGRGGMATVYLARARGLGGFEREVALKLTHTHLRDEAGFSKHLLEEARLAARIRHPNVVPVLDVGDDPRGVFLVMEYIEGDTLAGLVRAGSDADEPLPMPIALRILVDALTGLHAAHELCDDEGRSVGLVHRDFSPQNILVGVDGMTRLTDFGIARAANRSSTTRTGALKGKVTYMSPEQVAALPVDRRSDVFAAGVVAWQLLAGRRLYETSSDVETLLEIVRCPAPRLRDVGVVVPPSVDDAIAHALRTNVTERCDTALAFASAIESSGAAIASHRDVADYVGLTVGPMLSQRRLRLAERRSRTEPSSQPARTAGARRRPASWLGALMSGALLVVVAIMVGRSFAHRDLPVEPERPRMDPPLGDPPATRPEVQPAAENRITLTADAPISAIAIGSRAIVLPEPTASVIVDLVGNELSDTVTITATSSDGRGTTALRAPREASVELRFPAPTTSAVRKAASSKRGAPHAAVTSPTPTSSTTATAAARASAVPLATNPYQP
jgi:serine/threonine-protein kinase